MSSPPINLANLAKTPGSPNIAGFLLITALVLLAVSSSIFTVDQRQVALRTQLGEVIAVHDQPGLYFQIPLIQKVRYYDARIQTLDGKEAERVNTAEKKNVLVDSFVKYKIIDVKQYFVAVRGEDIQAQRRIEQTVNNAIRAEFGTRNLNEVVSGDREKLMDSVREKVKEDVKALGIEVVDVRLKRVDYVQEISETVYKRMESERRRVASELRATGAGDAEKITADADRQRQVILAEAYRDAERIKGEGDAKAAAIYAEAFNRNPEFFSFYRSLEAYKVSFQSKSDVLVVDPSSDFFKYLKGAKGNTK